MYRFLPALLLAVVSCAAPQAASQLEQRKDAPASEFEWINSEGPNTLAEMRGRVVLLEFWATW